MESLINTFTHLFQPAPIFNFADLQQVKRAPLKEGNLVPLFRFQKEKGLFSSAFWRLRKNNVTLKELHQKPLVLVFYSIYWNGHGISLLKKINSLQKQINAAGGIILVICAEEIKAVNRVIGPLHLELNLYPDTDHQLSSYFGVFSDDRPTWNLYSGVNKNIPLLATYVINPSGQIALHHIDDFSSSLSDEVLLAAIPQRK